MSERACRQGCGRNARPQAPQRGPWANLCETCHEERKQTASARARETWNAKRSRGEVAGDGPAADSFEAKALSLVTVGKRLDTAIAAYRLAEAGRRDAGSLLSQAAEQWKEACARLARSSEGRAA